MVLWNAPLWVAGLVAVGTLLVRWRRGSTLVRQQIGWLAAAGLITAVLITIGYTGQEWIDPRGGHRVAARRGGDHLLAVLQHHLFDIRVVVRRVVVYGALTGLITVLFVGVYSAVLAGASTQVGDVRVRWVAGLAAAAGVVLLAEPARRRLAALLEARFLGARHDPLAALARLQDRVVDGAADDTEVLQAVAETVAAAVRSPSVAVAVHRGPELETVASTGEGEERPLVRPLLYRGERLGELRVGHRTPARATDGPTSLCSTNSPIRPRRWCTGCVETRNWRRCGGSRWRLWRRCRPEWAGTCTTGSRRCWRAPDCRRRRCAWEWAPGPSTSEKPSNSPCGCAVRPARCVSSPTTCTSTARPTAASKQDLRRHLATLKGPGVPEIHLEVAADKTARDAVRQGAYLVILEAMNNVVRHARARHARVTVNGSAEELVLEVTDDGVGLDEAVRERGRHHLDAEPGAGTRRDVRPVGREGERHPADRSSPDPHMIRVVVVDDHMVFREGIRALLSRVPEIAVVGEAGTTEEAVAATSDAIPTSC